MKADPPMSALSPSSFRVPVRAIVRVIDAASRNKREDCVPCRGDDAARTVTATNADAASLDSVRCGDAAKIESSIAVPSMAHNFTARRTAVFLVKQLASRECNYFA
jgi:hypothetical protein